MNCAAHTLEAFGFDGTGHRSCVAGLNGNLATLRTARRNYTAGIKSDVPSRLEQNFAVLPDHDAIGANFAAILYETRVNSDLSAVRNDVPDVDSFVIGRGDFDPQIWRSGINDFDYASSREYYLAIRTCDDAAVLNIRRNQ